MSRPVDELACFLALTRVKGIGPRRAELLIREIGSALQVFDASSKELSSLRGMNEKIAREIRGFNDWSWVEEVLGRCREEEISILTITSSAYPPLLKEIPDPPPVLYMRGELADDDRFSVAIVGPRAPTEYGRRVADMMAGELVRCGLTVVSGMARGIDTTAHLAAIKNGGRTIAVLGSGIDVPYPPENEGLMKRIERTGAVISEFPPGTGPERENFPKRNRIISGLSLGVLVVEATRDSGALITARCGLEQGRDVFAVPGMITSDRSTGTNKLIRAGAILVERPGDILEEIAPQLKGYLQVRKDPGYPLTEEEKRILSFLSPEPLHIDEITRAAGMAPSRVMGLLTGLELKGVIQQCEGKRFCLPLR
jgi:DNA processing protein